MRVLRLDRIQPVHPNLVRVATYFRNAHFCEPWSEVIECGLEL